MQLYGLTGGIGAGKSEAARRFEEDGIPVIDADRIGHETIEPGGAAERGVIDAFGEAVLAGGRIDRQKLADRVFHDNDALQTLNRLVHPAVMEEVGRRTSALGESGHAAVIVEAALHAEDGRVPDWMAGLILVDCPEDLRVQRLVEHRDMDEADAHARMRNQTPPDRKRPIARWVIENDGDREQLYRQVDAIAYEILEAGED